MTFKEIYRGHEITASAVELDSGQWQPRFIVTDLIEVNPIKSTPQTITGSSRQGQKPKGKPYGSQRSGLMTENRPCQNKFHFRCFSANP